MKLNKSYFIIGIILLVISSILIIKNKIINNENNISIKCNNNYLSITKKDIYKINNYLKKEKLSKNDNMVKCMPQNTYIIEYNDYTLTFDNTDCTIYLYNNKTYENYQTTLSSDLKNYVKKICKKEN